MTSQPVHAGSLASLLLTLLAVTGFPARSLAEPEGERPDAVSHDRATTPFTRGTRMLSGTLGTSRDSDIGRIRIAQLGVDYYARDDLAVHVGVNLAYADPDDAPNGVQGGPEVGLRWHVLAREDWSAYLEGSAAPVLHEHSLTRDSLRFNFDLEGGVGATRRVTDEVHLRGGLRWHHLSNARMRGKSRNLGYDAPLGYVGLMKRF